MTEDAPPARLFHLDCGGRLIYESSDPRRYMRCSKCGQERFEREEMVVMAPRERNDG